jgi:uncharacterized protein YecE (DUF72 family)
MPCDIHVGTASWTDPTLLACGRFYPPDASTPERRLRHYASRFSFVEVDASYYRLPDPATTHRWTQRTPDHFVFNVKAFRLFTGHATPRDAFPSDLRRALPEVDTAAVYYRDVPEEIRAELWRRFTIAVEPLRMAGKLGALHFQFPPWVRRNIRSIRHVERCAFLAQEHTLAVEFRDASWFEGDAATHTLAWERELGAVHVVVDSPVGVPNTAPAVWETTHPELAVVRLHGRNAAAWNAQTSTSSGRFMYEYSPEELDELARRIARLSKTMRDTHVVLNTNFEDQGMRNAANLKSRIATLQQ